MMRKVGLKSLVSGALPPTPSFLSDRDCLWLCSNLAK